MKKKWWQEAVIYEIYCKSFCDSNGDGIGDLPGVISKLPVLRDLGVNCIWFTPIYTSPQVDLWICHKTSDQSDANYDSYFWKQANDAKSHASFSVPYTLSHEERREAISN